MNMGGDGFKKKHTPLIVMLLFCISAVFTIYYNSLTVDFVFDDESSIVTNRSIRMESISVESILTGMKGNRPLSALSFAMNYYFHGYNVYGYHLINIIIHSINSVLIFVLFTKLLTIAGYKEGWERRWIPVITALLWAVNPIHVQSVTYVVQRMTSMATMFYIASFLSYLTARTSDVKKTKIIFFALSVATGVLAILSKEIAVTLPVFILLYEWLFFRGADTGLLKKYIWQIGFLFILVPVAGFFIAEYFYSGFITSEYSRYNFDMMERCLTQFRVVIYYIGLMLFPHPSRLNLDYDFPVSHSIIDPLTTLIAILAVLASIAGALYTIFTKRPGGKPINKLIAFSILWYFGNLFIESSFIPLDMVFEHRTYLPSIMVFFMTMLLLVKILKNRAVFVIAVLFCMIVCSYWTVKRNKDWQTKESIWVDTSSKSPDKARPYSNIGICFEEKKKFHTAYKYYLKAIEKDPRYYQPYINIGLYYLRSGKYHESLGYFRKALGLKPDELEASVGVGSVLVKLKKYTEAIDILNSALKSNPNHIKANINIGEAYLDQNMFSKALEHYNIALQLKSEKAGIYYNLGILYNKMGQTDLSIDYLNRSIALDSSFASPHIMLGRVYTSSDSYEEAILHFKEAERLEPYSAACHEPWAFLLLKRGDIEGAAYHFKRIIEIEPENFMVMNNLAVCYMKSGMASNAAGVYKKMIQIQPDNNIVLYNLACAYSASGELEKSVETLKTTINKGFLDIEGMKKDPDLSMLMGSGIGRKFLGELDSK